MPGEITLSTPYDVDGKIVCDSFNYSEQSLGYHRAVRKGPFIYTSGTAAALPNGHIEYRWDAAKQARRALETALGAVERLGGKKSDVVRVKMFIADREDSVAIGNVYREFFGHETVRPSLAAGTSRGIATGTTATMIVVGRNGFVKVDMLVEIEIDAVLDFTLQYPPTNSELQSLTTDTKRTGP